MSDYEGENWEAFVQSLSNATAADRLNMLAMELKRHFVTIKNCADLSKYKLIDGTASTEEIISWLERIAEAEANASKITDAIVQAGRK